MSTLALLPTRWWWDAQRSDPEDALAALGDRIASLRCEVDQAVKLPAHHRKRSLSAIEVEAHFLRAMLGRRLADDAGAPMPSLPARIEARLKAFLHQTEAIETRVCEG